MMKAARLMQLLLSRCIKSGHFGSGRVILYLCPSIGSFETSLNSVILSVQVWSGHNW